MPPFWSIMPLLLGSSDIEPLVLHNQAPFNMPPIFFQHACRMLHSTWLYMLHFNLHHAPITCRKFPFNMHHAPKTCRMLQFMRKNDMPPSSFNIPKPPSNMPPILIQHIPQSSFEMHHVPCSIRNSSRSSHMSRIMLHPTLPKHTGKRLSPHALLLDMPSFHSTYRLSMNWSAYG